MTNIANSNEWLSKFIEIYIIKEKRDRYLSLLNTRNGKIKFLERLNHAMANDLNHAVILENRMKESQHLLPLLKNRGVSDTSFFFGFQGEEIESSLPLRTGVDALLNSFWGAVLVCPQTPVALYKEEDIGRLYYLDSRKRVGS